MSKKLIRGFCLLVFHFVSTLAFGTASGHLAELNSRFPYGLLSDDHGILTVNDLATNACLVRPKLFNPISDHNPYDYWQCFESKTVSFDCDSNGIPDDFEGIMGFIVVKALVGQVHHEYLEHRPWPIKECKKFIKNAAALVNDARHVCIAGSIVVSEKDHTNQQSFSWKFERIKTRRGCEGHHCDFTKKFKQDNCPELAI
jgi:hypothetical protein